MWSPAHRLLRVDLVLYVMIMYSGEIVVLHRHTAERDNNLLLILAAPGEMFDHSDEVHGTCETYCNADAR